MLREIAGKLDRWVVAENVQRREDGLLGLRASRIRLLGHMALIEQAVPLTLAATRDVDVVANYEFAVEQEFRRLLAERRFALDPVAHEAWMPSETMYTPLYVGDFISLEAAEPEAILVSKGLKAPEKNRPLLIEYIASGPSPRFFELAAIHSLDLESLV